MIIFIIYNVEYGSICFYLLLLMKEIMITMFNKNQLIQFIISKYFIVKIKLKEQVHRS